MVDEKNKKGLGRGLMSLFGDQATAVQDNKTNAVKKDINSPYLLISIGDLNRNRFQPRSYFDEKKIETFIGLEMFLYQGQKSFYLWNRINPAVNEELKKIIISNLK